MINQTFVSLKLLYLPFDKRIKGEDPPVNGAINGAEDENSRTDGIEDRDEGGSKDLFEASSLEAEAKSLVNGQQIAPKLKYDSVEVPANDKEMDDSLKRSKPMSIATEIKCKLLLLSCLFSFSSLFHSEIESDRIGLSDRTVGSDCQNPDQINGRHFALSSRQKRPRRISVREVGYVDVYY